jgi:Zn-dependent protease with chaperone function
VARAASILHGFLPRANPMNFFERQQAARKTSRRLLFLFGLAVVFIMLAVNAAVLLGLGIAQPTETLQQQGFVAFAGERSGVLMLASLVTLAIVVIASLTRISSLRAGGDAVARQLGGTPVPEETRDPQLRRLRNVVEEIAIASSVPVPDIYVLEQESGINAFAAGYSPSDAAVAVTRGALERLNRDELQGVIAHEFSHVLNGDMRLNIRLMGVLFGILVLGIIGRKVLEHSRGGRDSKGAAAIILIALAVMIVGYIGLFFGRLIKAGVSRQREYLADASAVQFTRQTVGIAGALKKIAGLPSGSKLAAAETEEVSHMLFGDGVGYSSLFATHPPLLERIQALDKSFSPAQLGELAKRWSKAPPRGMDEDLALGLTESRLEAAAAPLPARRAELEVQPESVSAQVGAPASDDFRRAGAISSALPDTLREAAQRPSEAMGVVLALLLDRDAAIRARQLGEIASRLDEASADQALAQQAAVEGLHPMLRLPLASLAFPLLRRRPRPELEKFLEVCDVLIHSDGQIGLFEYCLARMLRRQVIEALDPSRYRTAGRRKLAQSRDALADLFSVLAEHGHENEPGAKRAFHAGLALVLPGATLVYAPPRDWVSALDRALPPLDAIDPLGKQLLVEGLVAAISHDGRIAVAEAELLRVVCSSLHCPLPPMLEHAAPRG